MAMSHVRDTPGPLPADVPPAVAALVMHMLAKDPTARFPNGAALAQAVGQLRSGSARVERVGATGPHRVGPPAAAGRSDRRPPSPLRRSFPPPVQRRPAPLPPTRSAPPTRRARRRRARPVRTRRTNSPPDPRPDRSPDHQPARAPAATTSPGVTANRAVRRTGPAGAGAGRSTRGVDQPERRRPAGTGRAGRAGRRSRRGLGRRSAVRMVVMNPVIGDRITVVITDRQHATPARGQASSPRRAVCCRDGCARVRAASSTLVTGTTCAAGGHRSSTGGQHRGQRVRNFRSATRGRQ